jgi:hypothetical protein
MRSGMQSLGDEQVCRQRSTYATSPVTALDTPRARGVLDLCAEPRLPRVHGVYQRGRIAVRNCASERSPARRSGAT